MVEITLPIVLQILQTVGILVGIFYYIMTIRTNQRNQELTLKAQEQSAETRQAQLFMQMYNRLMSDSHELDMEKVVMKKLSGYNEYKEKWDNDPEFRAIFNKVSQFFEALGVLVKAGYVDIRVVALMWSAFTTNYWRNLLEPTLDGIREYYGFEQTWSEAEFLCRELIRYVEENPGFREIYPDT